MEPSDWFVPVHGRGQGQGYQQGDHLVPYGEVYLNGQIIPFGNDGNLNIQPSPSHPPLPEEYGQHDQHGLGYSEGEGRGAFQESMGGYGLPPNMQQYELAAPRPPSTERSGGKEVVPAKKVSEKFSLAEKSPIRFEDAIGRKFSFPFHLCSTWLGMEDLIKQAFLHMDILGPHVKEGHYDLIGPNGEIILPSIWEKVLFWEKVVQPGWSITMKVDKHLPAGLKIPGLNEMPPGGVQPPMPPAILQVGHRTSIVSVRDEIFLARIHRRRSIADIGPLITILLNDEMVSRVAQLNKIIRLAFASSLADLIQPVVDRSVNSAAAYTQQMIHKDFAIEPDETRVRNSAIGMIKVTAGSLALVTLKGPLEATFSNHMRKFSTPFPYPSTHMLGGFSENTIKIFVKSHLDIACEIIQKRVEEMAVFKIEEMIESELADRSRHRLERPNEPYVSSSLSLWASVIQSPFKLQPSLSGLNQEQMTIYEAFAQQSQNGTVSGPKLTAKGFVGEILEGNYVLEQIIAENEPKQERVYAVTTIEPSDLKLEAKEYTLTDISRTLLQSRRRNMKRFIKTREIVANVDHQGKRLLIYHAISLPE